MGSESKNNDGGADGYPPQIPPAANKIVQRLREIVNNSCTDSEIYDVLRECDMDPNEAAQRLLSEDTFHEVKSKRERRKEIKEMQERGNNYGHRVFKVGGEYTLGHLSSQISYNENSKSSCKGEDGLVASVPSSTLTYDEKTISEQPLPHSDSLNAESRRQNLGTGDAMSSSGQPSTATHVTCSWGGSSLGHVTMADIVRIGKPQNRGSQIATETSNAPQDTDSHYSSLYHLEPSADLSSSQLGVHKDLQLPFHESKMMSESKIAACQHKFGDEWPRNEQHIATSGSSILNKPADSGTESDNGAKLHESCQEEDAQVYRNEGTNSVSCNYFESSSSSSGAKGLNIATGATDCGDVLFQDMNSYDFHRCMHDRQEGSSYLSSANASASLNHEVMSTAVDFQKLSLGNEDLTAPSSEDNCAVVFPNYLEALATDCSHLSFGTYKSSVHIPVPLASNPLRSNLEDCSAAIDGSFANLEARNLGYVPQFAHNGLLGMIATDHDIPPFSQPELNRPHIPQVPRADEYISPASDPDSHFKKVQELSSFHSALSPNARNLSLRREQQASVIPVSADLLTSAGQSLRDSDHAHSSSLGRQSVASRYSINVPSSNPTMTMSEALNSSSFSLPKEYYSALPGVNLAKGSVHPQRLPSYAQSTAALEGLANLTGYPSMPKSHAHSPSALQQSYHDINVFRDSTTGMKLSVPQYKGSVVRSSRPLSDANSFGYGDFGSSTNLSGRFLHDVSSTHSSSAVDYNDIMHSQYREGNSFSMLQQDGSSSMWGDCGPGIRTMSNVVDTRNYSIPGQSRLLSRYPQNQQLAQSYDALGYSDGYHSQAGSTHYQQQHGFNDMSFSNSHSQQSKQVNQLWQLRYQ